MAKHEHCLHDLHWESAACCVCMRNFATSHDALVAALETITKGEGAYSRDPLTHASNTIDAMKATAAAALAAAKA